MTSPSQRHLWFFFTEIYCMISVTELFRKDRLLALHHLLSTSAHVRSCHALGRDPGGPPIQFTHCPFLSLGHSDSWSMVHISLIWCWITSAYHRPLCVLLLKPGPLSFSLPFSFVCEKQRAKTRRLLHFHWHNTPQNEYRIKWDVNHFVYANFIWMVKERKTKKYKCMNTYPWLKHQVTAFTTEVPKLGEFQLLEPAALNLARK